MKQRFPLGISVVFMSVLLGGGVSQAQQSSFSPSRETLVFSTLNKLQGRESALADSMKEAQLRLVERQYVKAPKPTRALQQEKTSGAKPMMKEFLSRVHPYVSTRITFDDNVASSEVDRKADFIVTTTPGFKVNFVNLGKTTAFDLHLGTVYNQKRFMDNKMEMGTSLSQTMALGLYSFSIGDSITTNYITTKRLAMSHAKLDKSWQNTFTSTLGRDFNRYGFVVGFERGDDNHDHAHRDSAFYTNTFSLSQYLRMATRTRLVFDYTHQQLIYPRNPGSATSTVTTTTSTGITTTSTVSSSGTNSSDTFGIATTAVLSPKVSFVTGLSYKPISSKGGADTSDVTMRGSLGYRLSDRTNLGLALHRILHSATVDVDRSKTNGGTFSGNHRLAFNPKLNLSFEFSLEEEEFTETEEYNHITGSDSVSFGLTYAFRQWIDFSLGFLHSNHHSNIDTAYRDNQFTFSSQAKF